MFRSCAVWAECGPSKRAGHNRDMNTRDEILDRLALGANCYTCGAGVDEPCITRRTGRETLPHARRIQRAVDNYHRDVIAPRKAREGA